jgi:ribosomal protein L3
VSRKGLLARKLGMTQVFNEDGTVSAVTVLEAGPCRVLGLRTTEKDGYVAVRLAFDADGGKRLNKPVSGEFKKAGLEPSRYVAEVRDWDGRSWARRSPVSSSRRASWLTSAGPPRAKAFRVWSSATASAGAPNRTAR